MSVLIVSFSSCFDEKSSESDVVLTVPSVSSDHGDDVGSCELGHFDDVGSRIVRHLHVECLSFVGVVELGVLRSLDVYEHHEDIGEEHV